MGFEIDVDLFLKPPRPFRLTDSTKTLRKGVVSSCLDELLFQAKMKMNIDPQVKVSLVLEEDETEVDSEEFFQTLKDHAVLVVITEPTPSRDATGNRFLEALLIPSKANIPGNNEKTDYCQNQPPTYEEAQNSISSNFDGYISNKPAPIVEEVTVFRSNPYAFRIQVAYLVDKKTGSKTLFVLGSNFEDSARGKLQTGDQILSVNGRQFLKGKSSKAESIGFDGESDKKMTFEILHDANFRQFKLVDFDIESRRKLGIGMVISCHPEMNSVLITKIDSIGRAKDAGLKVGERVFGINGISLMKVTMTDVMDTLRSSKETIEFLVQETKSGIKELEPELEPEPEPEPCCLLM